VVQCKRYAPGHAVGSPAIQQFIGMVAVHHRAALGLFVTTSTYTQPARTLASQHREYLQLLDGHQVAQLMLAVR